MVSCDRRMSLTERSSTPVGGMSSADTSQNATWTGMHAPPQSTRRHSVDQLQLEDCSARSYFVVLRYHKPDTHLSLRHSVDNQLIVWPSRKTVTYELGASVDTKRGEERGCLGVDLYDQDGHVEVTTRLPCNIPSTRHCPEYETCGVFHPRQAITLALHEAINLMHAALSMQP